MIKFNEIKKVLENNIVKITFTSLVSGEEKTALCTLNSTYYSNRVNQSESDRILVYRLDCKRWEDFQLNTIIKYEVA